MLPTCRILRSILEVLAIYMFYNLIWMANEANRRLLVKTTEYSVEMLKH